MRNQRFLLLLIVNCEIYVEWLFLIGENLQMVRGIGVQIVFLQLIVQDVGRYYFKC